MYSVAVQFIFVVDDMELSASVVSGLGAVGSESVLPEAAFQEVLRLAAQDVLTDERAGAHAKRKRGDRRDRDPDCALADAGGLGRSRAGQGARRRERGERKGGARCAARRALGSGKIRH